MTPARGALWTFDQVRDLAELAGLPDPSLAAAIAMAESGGDPKIIGDSGTSYGLWQIHAPDHPEFDPVRLLDPQYNAAAARFISKNGTDWSPWTTYRTGAYRKFLETA